MSKRLSPEVDSILTDLRSALEDGITDSDDDWSDILNDAVSTAWEQLARIKTPEIGGDSDAED